MVLLRNCSGELSNEVRFEFSYIVKLCIFVIQFFKKKKICSLIQAEQFNAKGPNQPPDTSLFVARYFGLVNIGLINTVTSQ